MKYRLLDFLLCKICHSEFKAKVFTLKNVENDLKFEITNPVCNEYCGFKSIKIRSSGDFAETLECLSCYSKEIIDGLLFCTCGLTYPIYKTVPRLLPKDLIDPAYYVKYPAESNFEKFNNGKSENSKADKLKRTKKTFDIEWTRFDYKDEIYGHTQEEEENDFIKRMRFDTNDSKNKLLLDAGCGVGRLIKNLEKYGIESVGVELSAGIDAACSENTLKKRIHFIQGDIADLSMRLNTFDYIYSKGVLHYTADAKKTFKHLARFSKKGGIFSVTIYPRLSPFFNFINNILRKLSLSLPPKAIYYISFLLIPFFAIAWRLSGFPSRHISNSERAHMIFNWLSSEYQNFHSEEEVIDWFKESGFSEISAFTTPMGVTGRRQ